MIAIPVKFDGETIEVPQELKLRGPGDVLLLVKATIKSSHSWRDVVGKVTNPPAVKEMDQWLRECREEWDKE